MASYLHPEVTYEYVEEVDPNLTCAICQSALVDPVTTASCKHTFCRDCITRAISINSQCPIDRSALTTQSFRDTEQLVKLMLDELKVRCGAEECGQVMQRGLLLGHVRTCQKTIITCHDGDCGLSMARFRLPHHRAYECFQRKMECSKCGVILTFKDQTAHTHTVGEQNSSECDLCGQHYTTNPSVHQWNCPQARVPCPQQARGCAALPPRCDLTNHLATCPFEALSSFFEINDARMAALQRRNEELSAELDRMRAELDTVRANVPRQTFGDRWRAAGLGGVAGLRVLGGFPEPTWTEEQVDPPAALLATGSEAPGLAPAIEIQPAPVASLPAQHQELVPPETSGPVSPNQVIRLHPNPSLSSPPHQPLHPSPSDTLTNRAAADMSFASNRNHLFGPTLPINSFADHAFQQLSPDRSTEDSVAALRTVAVHLAAGMDQMERRQEVRTMTENLRVLDEVGSLRAIVNTMRMQVMMDRPASLQPPPRAIPDSTMDDSTQGTLTNRGGQMFATLPAVRGLHRSMILAHRSMHPDQHEAERSSLDVEGWRQGIHESVAFSAIDTEASSLRGDRPESLSSRVTVGNTGPRGRPMAIPPAPRERESEGSSTVRGTRISLSNPLHLLSRRSHRGQSGSRP